MTMYTAGINPVDNSVDKELQPLVSKGSTGFGVIHRLDPPPPFGPQAAALGSYAHAYFTRRIPQGFPVFSAQS